MGSTNTAIAPDALANRQELFAALDLIYKYQDVLEDLPPNISIGQAIAISKQRRNLVAQEITKAAQSGNVISLPETQDLTECEDLHEIKERIDRIDTAECLSNIIKSVDGLHFWLQAETLALILNNTTVREKWGSHLRVKYDEELECLGIWFGDNVILELYSQECYEEFRSFFIGRVGCTTDPVVSTDGEVIASFVHGKVDPNIEMSHLVEPQHVRVYAENLALPKFAKCHILRRVCEEGPYGPYEEWEDHSSVYLQVHGADLVSFKKAGLAWLPNARKKKRDKPRLKRQSLTRADLLLSRDNITDRPVWGHPFSLLAEQEEA